MSDAWMGNLATASRFYDVTVAIDRMIWLAGALAFENSACDDIDSFWDDLGAYSEIPLELEVPKDAFSDEVGAWTPDDLAEHLASRRKFGFLAKATTPRRTPVKGVKNTFVSSWGSRYMAWIYGETLDEVREKAIAWAQTMHASDMKKGGARDGS